MQQDVDLLHRAVPVRIVQAQRPQPVDGEMRRIHLLVECGPPKLVDQDVRSEHPTLRSEQRAPPVGLACDLLLYWQGLPLLLGCGASTASKPAISASPSPSPTTTGAVIDHLKASGLPVGEVQTYSAQTDTNHLLGRPHQYTAKANFHDTRLAASPDFAVDGGGSVEIFATPQDLQTRATYVRKLAENAMFAEYDYTNGLVLLRVSHLVGPDQAAQYQQALTRLRA